MTFSEWSPLSRNSKTMADYVLELFTELSNSDLTEEYNQAFKKAVSDDNLEIISTDDISVKVELDIDSISELNDESIDEVLTTEEILAISLTSAFSFIVILCGLTAIFLKKLDLLNGIVILFAFFCVAVAGK